MLVEYFGGTYIQIDWLQFFNKKTASKQCESMTQVREKDLALELFSV